MILPKSSRKSLIICFAIIAICQSALAQTDNIAMPSDTIAKLPFYRKGAIGKIYDYFDRANDDREEKKLDISFIGGPHYSSESGFGLGVAGSGRYRSTFVGDTLTPFSNLTLKLDVTTGQLYQISASGYHILARDRFRFNYEGYFYSFADKWWGIGYDTNRQSANECNYKRLQGLVKGDFVYQLAKGLYVGPSMTFTYVNGSKFQKPELLEGQQDRLFSTSIGACLHYDTRDIPTAATRGINLWLNVSTFPGFLGNANHKFNAIDFTFSTYHKAWRGAVIAGNINSRFTWGHTPWNMLSTFGGSHVMRGYWEGRYRDKNESDVTIELRQNIWHRHGVAVFAGAGTVYPRLKDFTMRHVLPCAGIGYRWEFKKGVNVRLDVGFGRDDKNINFSLNEAF